MSSTVEVLGDVFVLRGVAATHVATSQANPQMHPCVSTCQAFFTAIRAGCDCLYLIEMCTLVTHFYALFSASSASLVDLFISLNGQMGRQT